MPSYCLIWSREIVDEFVDQWKVERITERSEIIEIVGEIVDCLISSC
jgi:hypothetical protein